WVVPMITEYKYFVTRPYVPETQALLSPWLLAWYGVALVGGAVWLRESRKETHAVAALRHKPQHTRAMGVYLAACLMLAVGIIFSATIAPSWFPLQAPRFLATLTFLLTVPVGFAIGAAFNWLARLLGEVSANGVKFSFRRTLYTSAIGLVLFLLLTLSAPSIGWAYAFYPRGTRTKIDDVLDFAREH